MSIPKHAKRVFQGKIFDIYQWRQKMFDGSVEIFEKATRPDTVIVIATQKDKLICLRQKQPNTKWFMSTPSGRMDVPGESPKQAALRELLEETGMKPKKLIFWKKISTQGKVISNIYFYIARDCYKVTEQKLDPGEKINVTTLTFDEFLKLTNSKTSSHWLSEMVIDMHKAQLNKKHKENLKTIFFGKRS